MKFAPGPSPRLTRPPKPFPFISLADPAPQPLSFHILCRPRTPTPSLSYRYKNSRGAGSPSFIPSCEGTTRLPRAPFAKGRCRTISCPDTPKSPRQPIMCKLSSNQRNERQHSTRRAAESISRLWPQVKRREFARLTKRKNDRLSDSATRKAAANRVWLNLAGRILSGRQVRPRNAKEPKRRT